MRYLFITAISIMLFSLVDINVQKDNKDEIQFIEFSKCNKCILKKNKKLNIN